MLLRRRRQVDMVKLMELVDRMVTAVPVYRLRCRNDISAAKEAIRYFGLDHLRPEN